VAVKLATNRALHVAPGARGARRAPGPMPYDTLVKEIHAILGK
jgi:hypothetical protein